MKYYLILLILAIADQLILKVDFHDYLIMALLVVLIIQFIRSLTYKISLVEIISLIGCLIYLVMPLLAYRVYNDQNALARLYDTTMQIKEDRYFMLALPGTLLMIIGLHTSIIRQQISDIRLIDHCRQYLVDKKYLGMMLIAIGVLSSFLIVFAPPSILAIVYFLSQLTYVGFLYLLHSRIKGKVIIAGIALALLIGQSAITGMYGELVYWSIFGAIILILGKRLHFIMRTAGILVGLFLVLVIQSTKHEYRFVLLSGSGGGSKPGVMLNLLKEKIVNPASVFEPLPLFSMVNRGNQGFLVARTMKYVPKYEEYAYGETILMSVAAAIVPRFLWADKPQIGGREMICRFLGDCRPLRYSYDIGQLGEAYVNFGIFGGAVFMFFYGLFIRTAYNVIANKSVLFPTLILWMPLFFFAALSLETDVLTFLNSFVKAVIFCLVVFFGFMAVLKMKI